MINGKNGHTLDHLKMKAVKNCKARLLEERFRNPIIKVEVRSGEILYYRLKEVWDSESITFCKACSNN